jgi:hypothetical protein
MQHPALLKLNRFSPLRNLVQSQGGFEIVLHTCHILSVHCQLFTLLSLIHQFAGLRNGVLESAIITAIYVVPLDTCI